MDAPVHRLNHTQSLHTNQVLFSLITVPSSSNSSPNQLVSVGAWVLDDAAIVRCRVSEGYQLSGFGGKMNAIEC